MITYVHCSSPVSWLFYAILWAYVGLVRQCGQYLFNDHLWLLVPICLWIVCKHTLKIINLLTNTSLILNILTDWSRDKFAVISQMTFSNTFSWIKMYTFWFEISIKFVPMGLINNIPAMVQIMACRLVIIWTNDGQFTDAYMLYSASLS